MPGAVVDFALAAMLGLALWPLLEYFIHGFLSHRWKTPVGPLHGTHHKQPRAVFTSPLAWVPLALLIFGAAWLAAGLVAAGGLSAGLLAGFARYERTHWRIHFRVSRNAREARLRQHHLAHHFVRPDQYHGVTTRLWDRVFGTLPAGCDRDYARVADHPPLEGPSNLRLLYGRDVLRRARGEAPLGPR